MKLSFLHNIVYRIINLDHNVGLFPQQNDRETLFFRDGKRRIDLVLVYEDEDISLGVMTEQDTLKSLHRQQFLENLLQEGLEIELEDKRVMLFNNACQPCLTHPWLFMGRIAPRINYLRLLSSDKNFPYNINNFPVLQSAISVSAWSLTHPFCL